MKNLTILLLVTAVTAFGFDVGGLTGGAEIDTSKADALLAKMDGVATSFTDVQTTLDAATAVLNDISAAHGITDALADPAATAAIAADLTEDEKAQLQAQVEALTKLPDDIAKITGDIPGIISDTPAVITDLTNQITDNPTKAGELNSLKDKLDAGTKSCETITEEAGTTLEKATALSNTISSIL
jgi:hypothetical protein